MTDHSARGETVINKFIRERNDVTATGITYVTENAISPKIPLEKLQGRTRSNLDTLALEVFGTTQKHFIVLGPRSSGKSFYIEQLAYHTETFSQAAGMSEPMVFITITEADVVRLGDRETIAEFVDRVQRRWGIDPSRLCLVTRQPQVALVTSKHSPETKIVLEMDIPTYADTLRVQNFDIWEEWSILDLLSVNYTPRMIWNELRSTLLERLPPVRGHKIDKKDLITMMEVALTAYPELHGGQGPEWVPSEMMDVAIVPAIGIWATALIYLHRSMSFLSDLTFFTKSGKPRMAKFIAFTLATNEYLFDQFYDPMTYAGLEDKDENEETVRPGHIRFGHMNTLLDRMREELFGQDSATEQVYDSLLVPAAGLGTPNRPIRSFLFLGPTGVGKTQLCLTMAKEVFASEVPVVRLDMSEYQESHEVAKLFGSPPGYVGHESGGALTEPVKRNPNCIVLLDEVEKAHPRVWDAFLQVLDAGRMTSGEGEVIDFTKAIIVMTSNIGAAESQRARVGFSSSSTDDEKMQVIKSTMEGNFRPEFINRIDEIVIFNSLPPDIVSEIAAKEITKIATRLGASHGVSIDFTPEVLDIVMEKADFKKYGARDIQRVVQKTVATPVARKILSESERKPIHLVASNGSIEVRTNQ